MIKLIAVDMDGTFLRSDNTYDTDRFMNLYGLMKEKGIKFVVASGNQYYQIKSFYGEIADELAYVAENGAYVKDKSEVLFVASMPLEDAHKVAHILNTHKYNFIMCGENGAYADASLREDIYKELQIYYHKLYRVSDFLEVQDKIFKFALIFDEPQSEEAMESLQKEVAVKMNVVTSGNMCADLIIPGCHKASGIKRLMDKYNIKPDECAAFGDSNNDIEMLKMCGFSYAMSNANELVKKAAKYSAPSNEEDGVLQICEQILK